MPFPLGKGATQHTEQSPPSGKGHTQAKPVPDARRTDSNIAIKLRTNLLYNLFDTMYYRRKILLALIEVFGGSLQSTDCEKLLFNFCQKTGKNHYYFFPYKYGPFSFLSY